jgi:hypothetical protein
MSGNSVRMRRSEGAVGVRATTGSTVNSVHYPRADDILQLLRIRRWADERTLRSDSRALSRASRRSTRLGHVADEQPKQIRSRAVVPQHGNPYWSRRCRAVGARSRRLRLDRSIHGLGAAVLLSNKIRRSRGDGALIWINDAMSSSGAVSSAPPAWQSRPRTTSQTAGLLIWIMARRSWTIKYPSVALLFPRIGGGNGR